MKYRLRIGEYRVIFEWIKILMELMQTTEEKFIKGIIGDCKIKGDYSTAVQESLSF